MVQITSNRVTVVTYDCTQQAVVLRDFAKSLPELLNNRAADKSCVNRLLQAGLLPEATSPFVAAVFVGFEEQLSREIRAVDETKAQFMIDDVQSLVVGLDDAVKYVEQRRGDYLHFYQTARVVSQTILFHRSMSLDLRRKMIPLCAKIENTLLYCEVAAFLRGVPEVLGECGWVEEARRSRKERLGQLTPQPAKFFGSRNSSLLFADLILMAAFDKHSLQYPLGLPE